MTITQKNIAQAAQVSQALVSLILSENAGGSSARKPLRVSPDTRQKVLDTAERLGYRGKSPSRSLTGETILWYLGRLAPDVGAQGHDLIRAVGLSRSLLPRNALLEEVSRQGLTLRMRLLAHESDLRSALQGETVDGVFLGMAIPGLREHLGPKVPLIAVGGRFLPEGDVVLANEREVMHRAVEFLHQNGHTRIALLAAGTEPDVAARRSTAFEEATKERGIGSRAWDADDLDVTQFLDRIFDPLESSETRPTAVIAEEALAMALQSEAIRRGCALPEELSLVGLGGSATSILTTSGVCSGEMARASVMLMNERLQNPSDAVPAHRKIEIEPTVTDRGSVARWTPSQQDHSLASLFSAKTPNKPSSTIPSGSQPPILA